MGRNRTLRRVSANAPIQTVDLHDVARPNRLSVLVLHGSPVYSRSQLRSATSAADRMRTLRHLSLAAFGAAEEANLFKPFATMSAKTLGSP